MKSTWLAAALVSLGTCMTGCAANGAAYVRYGPPPPRYGAVGYAPGPGYVWTDGYYDWRGGSGGSYVWVSGRWMQPPHRGARWVAGEWVHTSRGYSFRRGHWR